METDSSDSSGEETVRKVFQEKVRNQKCKEMCDQLEVSSSLEKSTKKKRKPLNKSDRDPVKRKNSKKMITQDSWVNSPEGTVRNKRKKPMFISEADDKSDEEREESDNSDLPDEEGRDQNHKDPPDFDDPDFAAIKKELSQMSFEELQKLRDRLGVKVYNQILHRGKRQGQPGSKGKKFFPRANKNRPMETSSKRPVPVLRDIIPVKKKIVRDPRFDDLSGEYKETLFKQAYSFLDDIKLKEKEKLKKQLKKTVNREKKQEIRFLLNKMSQEEEVDKQKQKRQSLEKEWKKKELEMVQQGKKPYFLTKGDRKKLELAEKYKELKKSGKLEKYLSKKRKKNASKEKKKLPLKQ